MSNKNQGTKRRDWDTIINKQTHLLHSDLKRGLLPYSILFFLKIRPHYSLEIQRKMSRIGKGRFKVTKNIIYENLRKFEQKGILGSYKKKSNIGPDRKYYYITEFGELFFYKIVVKEIYPLMVNSLFMFSTIIDPKVEKFGVKSRVSKKELNRLQKLVNEGTDN